MEEPRSLSRSDELEHLIYECALALIGTLDPKEIERLSSYTYVEALQRAQELASVALLRTAPPPLRSPTGRAHLSEQELAAIEARLDAGEVPQGETVRLLLAALRRALKAEERLQQFVRQKGLGMELQRYQEQQRTAQGEE